MIRITRKRLIVTTVVLLLLAGITVVTWRVCDWPPPRLILKYGLPPAGGPTGRRETVEEIEFIELSPGYYRMGAHWGCDEGDLLGRICSGLGLPWGKQPRHRSAPLIRECPTAWVEIPTPIWISSGEITLGQLCRSNLRSVAGRNKFQLRRSATHVTWEEAREYCMWLTRRHAGDFRLPHEAEWEYACRAGSSTLFWWGDDPEDRPQDHEVNPWGLRDMTGSLWEWTIDPWQTSNRREADGRVGPLRRFVIRGGHGGERKWEQRSSRRAWYPEDARTKYGGFRVSLIRSAD